MKAGAGGKLDAGKSKEDWTLVQNNGKWTKVVLENKTDSSANAASYLAGVLFVEEWQIELPNQGIHLKH